MTFRTETRNVQFVLSQENWVNRQVLLSFPEFYQAYELHIFRLLQPCVIRIEDVYETADVLYIVLELYHSLNCLILNIY